MAHHHCLPSPPPPLTEILLIGTGEVSRPPRPELVAYFRQHGIVVEQMNTTSSLSTFNILNEEDRRVAAALLHPSADWDDDE